jgi:2-C-methyl-D-erythritol 4-phosphate cytidylyltransferase
MAVALIVAAGHGERLGSDRPKALVMLAGKPMLHWSVEVLTGLEDVEEVVIALPALELDQAPTGTRAVAGGAVRSESVRRALAATSGGDPVIVHDAARPLASRELFRRAVSELQRTGADAIVAALPVSDTLKEADPSDLVVSGTPDRSRLWAVQTPQVFRRASLESALNQASQGILARATDDAWLIERAGGDVRVVAGESENIKITTPVDLRVAELLLRGR